VKPRKIEREKARAALAAVHGFLPGSRPRGKSGALAVARRMSVIQSDPLDIAGRNHDLTLQSRVDGYRPRHLFDLLYKDRELFEYYCKMASIMPVEVYPAFQEGRARMRGKNAAFFKEHAREARDVMHALESGPVCSRDFESEKKVDWWGRTQVYRVVLEKLFVDGRTLIHRRDGGVKYYAMAEKLISPKLVDAEGPSGDDYRKAIALMICRASRLVSPSRAPEQWWEVGKTDKVGEILARLAKEGELFAMELEGWKGHVYAIADDERTWKDPPEADDWCRFVAPLDPLLWNRRLFAHVYGREYVWEVYKRAHERKYGYYCLPVLFNDGYVALIEPWYEKKEKKLEIKSFHLLDKKADRRRLKRSLAGELESFAEYLGAKKVLAGKVRL